MLFFQVLVGAAMLAIASARVILTNSDFSGIADNVPFTITWSGQTGPVTLKLNSGPALAQVFVATIATGLTGQSYAWTPQNLPTGTYIIEIDDAADVNYSIAFPFAGVAAPSSSITPTTSTASATPSTLSTSTSAALTTSLVSSGAASSSAAATTSTVKSSNSSASATASKTTSSTSSPTPGSAARYGSPLALVLAAFIAFSFLN